MSECVLHNDSSDECMAKGLYCFDPEPESYTECIALNCAYNLGVIAGVKKCTAQVRKTIESMTGKKND